MIKALMGLFTKAPSPWLLGGAVTLLLSVGLLWNNFKDDLREEGIQICVQEINKQTVIDLQDALAAERATTARLQKEVAAANAVNEQARARLDDSQERLSAMAQEMREQEETDETYRTWSNTPLPDGVADRLRRLDAESDPHTGDEDSN